MRTLLLITKCCCFSKIYPRKTTKEYRVPWKSVLDLMDVLCCVANPNHSILETIHHACIRFFQLCKQHMAGNWMYPTNTFISITWMIPIFSSMWKFIKLESLNLIILIPSNFDLNLTFSDSQIWILLLTRSWWLVFISVESVPGILPRDEQNGNDD